MAKPTPAQQAMLPTKNAQNIETPWLQVFVMGDMGGGKTSLAATFPRPLFLVPSNEQSMTALKGLDFPYIEITSMDGPLLQTGSGGMLKAITALELMYAKDPTNFPYDTIVLEQIGHYSDIIQNELTDNGAKQMDQQKWGAHLRHFLSIQSRLSRLDVHRVWTCHTKVEKVNDATIYGINVSGQAATKIPSACDIVAYCEAGHGSTPKYRTHFRRFAGFNARSRLPLPPVIENCTFQAMWDYITAPPQEGV